MYCSHGASRYLISLLLAFACALPATASTTYYVNDASLVGDAWCSAVGSDANSGTSTGAPKETVRAILASYDLEPGDTIFIDTGNYTLATNIEITAADGGSAGVYVTLQGSPTGAVLDRATTAAGTYCLLLNTADCVRVSGLTLVGGSDAVSLRYANFCAFSNVTVRSAGATGIALHYSDNNFFQGLDVRQCGGAGVSMGLGSDDNTLLQSTVWSNASYGVAAAGDLFVAYSRSNRIENCTVAYNAGHQVHVSNMGSLSLSNSIVVASGVSNCCVFRMDTYKGGSGGYVGDYNDLHAVNGAFIGGYSDWDPPPPFINPVMCAALTNWQALFGQDAHSLSADPLFVSAGGDFHLRSSATSGTYVKALGGWTNYPGSDSPCLDAGDPLKPCGLEPLWNGARLNLGAYGNTAQASRSPGGPTHAYYVNDNSTASDVWCTAAGSDANPGNTPASPKATVKAVIDTFDLEPGDTIYVDTGFYPLATNILVGVSDSGSSAGFVTFQGSSAGSVLSRTNWPGIGFLVDSASYVRITGLSFTGACWHSIHIKNSARCVLENVRVRGGGSMGVYVEDCVSNEFTDVEVGRGDYTGMELWDSFDQKLVRVTLWSNAWDGLYMADCTNVRLESCVIAHNSSFDISALYCRWSMSNSIVYHTGVGIAVYNAASSVYEGDHNNFFFPSGYHGTLPGTSGQDRHSLAHDPLFANSTNGDFHLRSETGRRLADGSWAADGVHSPCIDTACPSLPWANEPAPNGARANIGCHANTADASKSRTNAWILATSFNNGGRLSGTTEVFWAYGNLSDTNRVRIDCSLDDGSTWQVLASNVSVQASQVWNTMLTATSTPVARWRVTVQGNAALTDTTDRPFELRNGPMNFYVNDSSLDGDVWCAAAGDDANSGGYPGAPKASVSAVIDTYDLEPGDTVYIDTGYYLLATNITVNYEDEGSQIYGPVTFKGSPNGTTLDRGTRNSGTWCFAGYYGRWLQAENLLLTNGQDGLVVVGEGCVFSNITVRNAARYGVYVRTYTQKFYGLDVRGCQDGLNATHGQGVDYENCLFAWNSGDGAHLQYLSEGYIAYSRMNHCTFAYNGYKQIDMTGYYRLDLRNSIVVASGSGNACIYQFWQMWQGGHGSLWAGDGLYYGDYNLLYAESGATIGGNSDEGYTNHTYQTLADWRAYSGQDANSLSAEPKFVDGGDLHLRSAAANGTYVTALGGWTNFPGDNSPAIDAGCPTNPCTGEPQWDGDIVNAGAYGNTPFASRSADSDGDWLSDSIEQYHYGSNPNNADSDGDGMGDRFELLAGTDATNSASLFEADGLVTPADAGNRFVLQWPSVAGRSYRIECSTNILSRFTNLTENIPATPPLNCHTVVVTGVERELFRVGLEQ